MRNEVAQPVLLLDAGHTLYGQRLSSDSDGRVVVEAMNSMGYDAMAIGRMELAMGMVTLEQRAGDAIVPVTHHIT